MDTLVKKVFEALGVQPNEKFKIKEDRDKDLYYLDENLCGYLIKEKGNELILLNSNFLRDILKGELKIVKQPRPLTKEDKIIIDYARLCGFKWIAVDKDGEIVASNDELNRSTSCWAGDLEYLLGKLSFLTWEDKPYYIGKEE